MVVWGSVALLGEVYQRGKSFKLSEAICAIPSVLTLPPAYGSRHELSAVPAFTPLFCHHVL